MTDDPNLDDEILDDAADDAGDDDAFHSEDGVDPAAAIAEAAVERLHRQAYWHQHSKQLFAFLFANCLFFVSGFAAWTRAGYTGEGVAIPVDPSLFITGLDTIRGSFIFALSIYGFWTAVFNIWHAQMKIWPYMLAGMLALWVGIGGIVAGFGSDQMDNADKYLKTLDGKTKLDDWLTPLGTIAPGYWLCAFGGLVVVWVIVSGLLKGQQKAKAEAASDGGGGSSRRRR